MTELLLTHISVRSVSLALEAPRAISREVSTHANLIEVSVEGGGKRGQGQAAPTPYWGESVAQALADFERLKSTVFHIKDRAELQRVLPPGALRNAIDCAFWDLEAKLSGQAVEAITGVSIDPVTTAFTISLDTPDAMAALAKREQQRPLIKIKLGHFDQDAERLRAIRQSTPKASLIVDANQGWSLEQLKAIAPVVAECGVELIEQPLAASMDQSLSGLSFPAPLCADESCHTHMDLARLEGLYQFINIKLDKTGGLTEALILAEAAKAKGFGLMIGCTWGSTLAMAPAFLVAQSCRFADLDAPLFLAEKEQDQLVYHGSTVAFAPSRTWGH